MAGLHDIAPIASRLKLTRATEAPIRAAAAAASQPAWPPPITIMSKLVFIVPRETLLADAETTEQRIEHVFDASTARYPVEHKARQPQSLGAD